MSRRVILRRDVPDDLHNIVRYLELHSIDAADRFVEALFPALEELAQMPGKGSPKHFNSPKLEGIRSWSVPRFRQFLILYRSITDGIEVLAITHGSRDLRTFLLSRVH
jgi:plasmid stabilization system protein ParE